MYCKFCVKVFVNIYKVLRDKTSVDNKLSAALSQQLLDVHVSLRRYMSRENASRSRLWDVVLKAFRYVVEEREIFSLYLFNPFIYPASLSIRAVLKKNAPTSNIHWYYVYYLRLTSSDTIYCLLFRFL